jgi:hypothetical protein
MAHHHDTEKQLPFEQKLAILLKHWIQHNAEHASTFREWAGKARAEKRTDTALFLEEASEMTLQISQKLEKAAEPLKTER